jgi:hypothetical protein
MLAGKTYSVKCPDHPKQEIGEINWDFNGDLQLGYWCRHCKKTKRFTRKDIIKYLRLGFFSAK